MERTSKLYLNFLIFIGFIAACNSSDLNPTYTKNQLVVVVDKSSSVSYEDKISDVRNELFRNFNSAYDSAMDLIQYSLFTINEQTKSFADPVRFNKKCGAMQKGARTDKKTYKDWQEVKNIWINSQVQKITDLIHQNPQSQSTDVFSIFTGLQHTQAFDGPWDRIRVLIYSDMIHTMDGHNMRKGLNKENAFEKGKVELRDLLQHGRIKKGDTKNLFLTIYTPTKMEDPSTIELFWKGFFEEWGLPESQYQFQ